MTDVANAAAPAADAEFNEVEPTPKSQLTDESPSSAREAIQSARALIPVGPSGAAPMNFAQQVDFAKTMAQARSSLPAHLADSPGDCLAILDIASRANLSPFMVANMTYVEPRAKRLSFMSQLYHAFLIQSKMLVGDLDVEYAGEGDARTCTVSGKLRSDGKVRSHTSPPLGKVRPPMGERGARKGSPLWDKKPDVQLFYDTSRDWVRIHCPTATLGIFAPEEFEETPVGPETARDVTGLAQRLAGTASSGEGFQDGHAARELSQVVGDRPVDLDGAKSPGEGAATAGAAPPAGATASGGPQGAGKGKNAPAASGAKRHRVPSTPPSKAAAKAAADRAEKRSAETAPKPEPKPAPAPEFPKSAERCKTVDEYFGYAKAWIDASTKHLAATDRFDEESADRRRLKVPVKLGAELQNRIDVKFGAV